VLLKEIGLGYSAQFIEAFLYAARLHADQRRKGTGQIPYINHLMAVAVNVAEYGGDENQVIAGLLHDAAEDQGGRPRLEDIRQHFGDDVAGLVEACTDTFESPKPQWRARKEAYLAHLRQASPRVLLLSAADKLHNARTIVADLRREGLTSFDKFNGGRDGTLWYYRELTRIYLEMGCGPIAEELERVVNEMHASS
jgi:(p)ppGpp synthase/HD superfamily hydrolase